MYKSSYTLSVNLWSFYLSWKKIPLRQLLIWLIMCIKMNVNLVRHVLKKIILNFSKLLLSVTQSTLIYSSVVFPSPVNSKPFCSWGKFHLSLPTEMQCDKTHKTEAFTGSS